MAFDGNDSWRCCVNVEQVMAFKSIWKHSRSHFVWVHYPPYAFDMCVICARIAHEQTHTAPPHRHTQHTAYFARINCVTNLECCRCCWLWCRSQFTLPASSMVLKTERTMMLTMLTMLFLCVCVFCELLSTIYNIKLGATQHTDCIWECLLYGENRIANTRFYFVMHSANRVPEPDHTHHTIWTCASNVCKLCVA